MSIKVLVLVLVLGHRCQTRSAAVRQFAHHIRTAAAEIILAAAACHDMALLRHHHQE